MNDKPVKLFEPTGTGWLLPIIRGYLVIRYWLIEKKEYNLFKYISFSRITNNFHFGV